MSIIRVDRRHRYVSIDITCLHDDRLSFRAKGLHAYLMSKPNDWQINLEHLSRVSKEGREAVASAMQELIQHGYASRQRVRQASGRLDGYETVIYERPQADFPKDEKPKTVLPTTVLPNSVEPNSENAALLNIDVPKIEIPKIEKPKEADAHKVGSSRRVKTYFPDDPTEQANLKDTVFTSIHDWAVEQRYDESWLNDQWNAFVLKAQANAYKYADWTAAFRNWLTSPYQNTKPKHVLPPLPITDDGIPF